LGRVRAKLGLRPLGAAAVFKADDVAPKAAPALHFAVDRCGSPLGGVDRVALAQRLWTQRPVLGGHQDGSALASGEEHPRPGSSVLEGDQMANPPLGLRNVPNLHALGELVHRARNNLCAADGAIGIARPLAELT